MDTFVEDSRTLTTARWLIIAILVSLLFSPPLTNMAELLLVLLVCFSSELRVRVARACRQPMVIGALAFYVVLSIGVLYSMGNQSMALSMWGGWRKLLLLPLSVALFDNVRWKSRLAMTLVVVASVCALASWIGMLLDKGVYLYPPGIIVRNHATQGMLFAVAAFTAATFAVRETAGRRGLLVVSALLLVANVVFVTPGRSGYVVLLVCGLIWAVWLLFADRRPSMRLALVILLVQIAVIVAMVLSPVARQRIEMGVKEMQTYQQARTETSMGVRMFFWKNTLEMIRERPVFGYGTGAFEDAYRHQVVNRSGVAATVTSDPHNQFLKIAAENGLTGLAVFIVFLLSALYQRPSNPYRVLGLGVLAAWCATSLFNSHFSTFSEGLFFYLWVGAMLAGERKTSKAPP